MSNMIRSSRWYLRCCRSRDGGCPFEHHDAIGEVGRHDEVVLDDKRGSLSMQDEPLDDLRSNDTLLGIEERGRFIQKIDVRL